MKCKSLFIFFIAILVAYPRFCGGQSIKQFNRDSILIDPAVSKCRLANGFTYYIRKNDNPRDRIFFNLVVGVGALAQDSDQLEVAHVLEHMAFRGTGNFPNPWKFLEDVGVRMGVDGSASTTSTETVYWFSVPSGNSILLRKCLLLMKDFCQNLVLDSLKLDGERKIVLEESRRASGYNQRLRNKYYPILVNNSEYVSKVGTVEERQKSIFRFSYSALDRFYRDWYRPNLQALIVVGDVDSEFISYQIDSLFSVLKNPNIIRPLDSYKVPLLDQNQFLVAFDDESPNTEVNIYIKSNGGYVYTVSDLRKQLIIDLYNRMASERFVVLKEGYGRPFRDVYHSFLANGEIINLNAIYLSVFVKSGMLKEGLQVAISELERIRKYGFSGEEFDAAKREVFDNLKVVDLSSEEIMRRLQIDFMGKGVAADIEEEMTIRRELLGCITVAEVNSAIANWITDRNRDVIILARPEDSIPSEKIINRWIAGAKKMKFSNHKVKNGPADLASIDCRKDNVNYTKVAEDSIQCFFEYDLENGVHVILKRSKNCDNRIYVHGFSSGGAMSYTGAEYAGALNAAEIVRHSGVGSMSKFDLSRYSQSKAINVYPYINLYTSGIRGDASINEIHPLLKLINYYLLFPRKDREAFNDWMHEQYEIYKEDLPTPFDKLKGMESGNCGDGTSEYKSLLIAIEHLGVDAVYEIYKSRFSGLKTFVFVGDFDVKSMISVVAPYLGALSGYASAFSHPERNCGILLDTTISVVSRMRGEKASVRLTSSRKFDYSTRAVAALDILNDILQKRLFERLRVREGGTYQVMSQLRYFRHPGGIFKVTIDFECSEDNVESLVSSCLDEISMLSEYGPNDEEVNRSIVSYVNSAGSDIGSCSYWSDYLATQSLDNGELGEIFDRVRWARETSVSYLKDFAKKHLDHESFSNYIILPLHDNE